MARHEYHHLYGARAWRRRRARQLQAEPLCAFCKAEGRVTPANIADHIEPHRGDPVKFAGPLQSLCASCHSSRKQQMELTGHFRGHDATGRPIDPLHHWNAEPGGQIHQKEASACQPPPDA